MQDRSRDYSLLRSYVQSMSEVLLAEGKCAGLFDHPTLTGDARESFVHTFFRRLLPHSIGIGKGKVFDRYGAKSSQLDVVIYDRNFPIINIGGHSLFPLDSVCAIVEVKSELNAKTIDLSMSNCKSVGSLSWQVSRLSKIKDIQLASENITIQEIDQMSYGYYVIGFEGYSTDAMALTTKIGEYILDKKWPRSCIPRVIATPTCFGLRKRDNILILSDKKSDVVFASLALSEGFNVLIADILEKVLSRMTYLTQDLVFRTMKDYFDPNWYLDTYITCQTRDWKIIQVEFGNVGQVW